MTSHTSHQTIIKSLNILQLNCHRSPAVFHSLFNDPTTTSRHVLMLQEPAVYPHTGLPMVNPNWVQFIPSCPPPVDPNAPSIAPRCRCVTYISKNIQSHLISQINSSSDAVVSLTITPPNSSLPVHLINAYLPPSYTKIAESLSHSLDQAVSGPVLLGMDSNLHHPTWNPPLYHHTHQASEELILLAASHHLTLRSELGVPTFYATSDRQSNTTIDLVWANDEALELATSCVTDASFEHSYSSDHAAILTTLNLPDSDTPLIPPAPRLNWKKADEQKLVSSLSASLQPLTHSLPSSPTRLELDACVNQVTEAINTSVHAAVPLAKPLPNARRWWNSAVLDPMKKRTAALRRKFQLYKSEDNKAAYLKASKTFHLEILCLKHEHWKTYLLELDDKSLFNAAKLAEGPTPSSFIPPLRGADGSLTSDPSAQADLIFAGTSAPMVEIDLSDITTPSPRPRTSLPFTLAEAVEVIDGLKPSKAPGPDKIPSRVLQLGGRPLAQCIVEITNASLSQSFFPTQWKIAKSVILKKVGKPDYANPGAYRPIALLNTLSKTIAAMLANRIRDHVESNSRLHPGHFGGRRRRSTTDALLHLTSWIKSKWRESKFVGALFVDVQAAFPTVHPSRMVSTLSKMGVCPSICLLIEDYLSQRSTTISFGDYESPPKSLTIGLPQGSPLSVILYIIYNSSLLEQSFDIPDTISLGFIDDVAFVTAANSAVEVADKLQVLASRELRWGKQHGAAFDKKKSQWVLFTHRQPNTYPADLTLRLASETLSPQASIKWLGVVLDPKLSFKLHGQLALKKGTLSLLKLRSLARSGWGISIKLFLRLTSALVHSRTDYASIVWHSHGKPSATTHSLQRLDNTAQRLALGAFRSHPIIFLRHDSNSISTLQRLDSKSDSGAVRLLSLPPSNPASHSILKIAAYSGSRHLHPLHYTLSSTSTTSGSLVCPMECIDPSLRSSPPPYWLNLCTESEALPCLEMAKKTPSTCNTLIVHCAGTHHQSEGAYAAAYAPLSRSSLSFSLDHAESSTSYEAEMVALWLAARLAKTLQSPATLDIHLFSPSLRAVTALLNPSKPTPGQALRRALWDYLTRFNSTTTPETAVPNLNVRWCPANHGLADSDKALELAEKASTSPTPALSTISLPSSVQAATAKVKRVKRQLTTTSSPFEADLTRLRGFFDPPTTIKALSALPDRYRPR